MLRVFLIAVAIGLMGEVLPASAVGHWGAKFLLLP